jgi:hypothetical protein
VAARKIILSIFAALAQLGSISSAIAQFAPVLGADAPGLSVAIYGNSNGVQRTIVGQPFLGVNQGGTGLQALPANGLLIGQGFGPTGPLPVGAITPFSPGGFLIDQGPGQNPQFRHIYGAINVNADGFATLTGDAGPPSSVAFISASTTLNVPSTFATIPLALASLQNAIIAPGAVVTVSVAAGTYTATSPINLANPYGSQVNIVGPTPISADRAPTVHSIRVGQS